jgi:hypothetical protein
VLHLRAVSLGPINTQLTLIPMRTLSGYLQSPLDLAK